MNAHPPTPQSWARLLCALRGGRGRAGAFTLIEILIVVGIMGLTLTMGVPAFVRALHKEGMRKARSDLPRSLPESAGRRDPRGQDAGADHQAGGEIH